MPIYVDTPPARANDLVDAAIAARLHDSSPFKLGKRVTITAPILRRHYAIRGEAHSFRYQTYRLWDYFILSGDAVALASVRQRKVTLRFERLSGGPFAIRLFQAIRLMSAEAAKHEVNFRLRIVENQSARLMSLVLRAPTHNGLYMNVFDRRLVEEEALEVRQHLGGLLSLAHKHLVANRGKERIAD